MNFLPKVLNKVLETLLGFFGAPCSDSAPGNCAPLVTHLRRAKQFLTRLTFDKYMRESRKLLVQC